jgi:hypothetical protein
MSAKVSISPKVKKGIKRNKNSEFISMLILKLDEIKLSWHLAYKIRKSDKVKVQKKLLELVEIINNPQSIIS